MSLNEVVLYEQTRLDGDCSETRLQRLQTRYTALGPTSRISERLAEEPALYLLLTEAVDHIHQAFGNSVRLQLRAQESDEDELLRVTIQSAFSFRDAEEALDRFDESWWLDNCHRSAGSLVFDYAIRDDV